MVVDPFRHVGDPPARQVVDLFAGAGGWEEGLREIGHRAVGIELDPWASATARMAGHERLRADVVALDPHRLGPVWGLIGSPPCQAYSTSGKMLGRADRPQVIACAHELAAGNDTRSRHARACRDPRSLLTVEPLRWALALRPRWVALEQVPPVLEMWSLFGSLLALHGYEVAVGVLSAERYGVPQTRRRAFLIASLDGPVTLPEPTHRSYNPHRPDQARPEEQHLPPWVSMADALGWPTTGVTFTNCQTNHGTRPRGHVRPTDRPARTVDSTTGAWTVETDGDELGGMHTRQHGSRTRPPTRPAPTLTVGGLANGSTVWVAKRPATTVLGDARIQPPGHKRNASDPPGRYESRSGPRVVRVTVEQAAILQGFRPDYPWVGARSRAFQQIGNAVPPPLARRVLEEAMRPTLNAAEQRRRPR